MHCTQLANARLSVFPLSPSPESPYQRDVLAALRSEYGCQSVTPEGMPVSANEQFFAERRPQAVFKHAVLSQYLPVLFNKVGKRWPVVYVDGYAGRGEYEDGSAGSPLWSMRSAAAKANVRSVYVERDVHEHRHLARVVREHGRPADQALHGDIATLLPRIVADAKGSALFVFLDPFGAALDRTQLLALLAPPGPGDPPVEVLLHFSISTIARFGGLIRMRWAENRELSPSEAKTVEHGDRFLGGTWWQKHFRPLVEGDEGSATDAAMRVAAEYQRRIREETGVRSVSLPIRVRPGQSPKYLLVLFTRHADGQWAFAAALGRAGRDWQAAWRDDADAALVAAARKKNPDPGFFPVDDWVKLTDEPFNREKFEREHRSRWVDEIAANIARLVGQGPVVLASRVDDVYGALLGLAYDTHVRAAVKKLHAAGVVDHNGTGKYFFRDLIRSTVPRPAYRRSVS